MEDKSIIKQDNKLAQPRVFFEPQKGSNYKVLMTYDRAEIIEYELFEKIMLIINDGNFPFLTINDRVVNKTTIIDISPTEEPTKKQAQAITEKREKLRKTGEKLSHIREQKMAFERDFFDSRYGLGNWYKFESPFKQNKGTKVSFEEIAEATRLFYEEHPGLEKAVESMMEILEKSE